jgi:hypothetical protein
LVLMIRSCGDYPGSVAAGHPPDYSSGVLIPAPVPSRSVDLPLVGREEELAALRAWLAEAGAGRGRTVLVAGEAGIGKSRLLAALAGEADEAGATVLWGRTTELDGAPPYWPWLQVLEPLGGRAPPQASPSSSWKPPVPARW